MASQELGKVSLTPKGDYSSSTPYERLDIVSYNGGSYLALQNMTGVEPADDGTNWMQIAAPGSPGSPGTPGTKVARVERTSGTGAPGTTDTYTMYDSEDTDIGTFTVYNGSDGTGSGDFKADGTVPMTGNLQMGNNKITGMADGTDDTDGATVGQVNAKLDAPSGGTAGQVLTKTDDGTEWSDPTGGGLPPGGEEGQVLTKTASGANWQDPPDGLPEGGTDGQILTKTEDGVAWENPPEGGVTSFNSRTGAITPQSGDYTAEMVGARPNTWTPSAADVGAVPTTRTVNSKPLSENITLTATDVGAGAPATSTTITLTSSGWTGDSAPFSQEVACSIVAADTKVVSVDVDTPGTDADADNEAINAWALVSQRNPAQGAGTLTFYANEKPTINIPVKVGVS